MSKILLSLFHTQLKFTIEIYFKAEDGIQVAKGLPSMPNTRVWALASQEHLCTVFFQKKNILLFGFQYIPTTFSPPSTPLSVYPATFSPHQIHCFVFPQKISR